jgi:hypothetical protein
VITTDGWRKSERSDTQGNACVEVKADTRKEVEQA